MGLIFYATDQNGVGRPLRKLHQELASEHQCEFYQTIDSLSQKLRQPLDGFSIAVFLASSHDDLMDFITIKDLLDEVRIILILPDRNEDTVKAGHTLRPRFLTYVDSNFSWVETVLKKMLSSYYDSQ
jgi:hypothetical protein